MEIVRPKKWHAIQQLDRSTSQTEIECCHSHATRAKGPILLLYYRQATCGSTRIGHY